MLSHTEAARRVGAQIAGRYRLRRLVATGGMGAVYEAEHRWTRARVAVKLLFGRAFAAGDPVARFAREAQAITRVGHKNIVAVLDMGQDRDGTVYIAQEFLDGDDLGRHLAAHGPLAPRDARAILLPVIDALAAAHRAGVVHRDIKPANVVLVRSAGGALEPRVIDFGIAKMSEGEGAADTGSGLVLGTPAYMAPEQARGERHVDARADVWSVGAVLYEMLTGRAPYRGDNHNAVLAALLTTEVLPLADLAPDAPPDLCALVHRALARRREERLDSMDALRAALLACEGFARETPLVARAARGGADEVTAGATSLGSDVHDVLAPVSAPRGPVSVRGTPRGGRWRGRMTALGAVVLVAGASALGVARARTPVAAVHAATQGAPRSSAVAPRSEPTAAGEAAVERVAPSAPSAVSAPSAPSAVSATSAVSAASERAALRARAASAVAARAPRASVAASNATSGAASNATSGATSATTSASPPTAAPAAPSAVVRGANGAPLLAPPGME